ncbi:MAG: YqhA family protein, partial [Ilumatobacteraceae bacterium]
AGWLVRSARRRLSTERHDMLELIFKTRWISAVAVVFSGLGAALMMIVGAVSTVDAFRIYFGGEKQDAFSEDAALKTTTALVSSLDEFLLGLVLFIFAYGVFRLFLVDKLHGEEVPDWFSIHSVTDLKVKLLETIAILLAVVFLKAVLGTAPGTPFLWTDLVTPIAVGIFALSILVIKRAH